MDHVDSFLIRIERYSNIDIARKPDFHKNFTSTGPPEQLQCLSNFHRHLRDIDNFVDYTLYVNAAI